MRNPLRSSLLQRRPGPQRGILRTTACVVVTVDLGGTQEIERKELSGPRCMFEFETPAHRPFLSRTKGDMDMKNTNFA